MNINELLNKANEVIEEAQGVIEDKEAQEVVKEVEGLKVELMIDEATGESNNILMNITKNKLEEVKDIEGIHISTVGVWIWIEGETKAVKEELKEKGFKYSQKNKAWWFNPGTEYKKFKGRKYYTKEERAEKYGETIIK